MQESYIDQKGGFLGIPDLGIKTRFQSYMSSQSQEPLTEPSVIY